MIPGVHHCDRVGHGHGLLLVVGDVHEGLADLVLDPLDLDLHRPAQLEVERAEWLVEQQHLGAVDERPCERDPLLLATGELGGLLASLAAQLHQVQHLPDLRVDLGRLTSPQPERHVLVDVEVREQRVALEHRVDRAPVGLREGDVVPAKRDRPRRGGVEPRDHPQGGGLAAARGSKQGEERAAWDVEVQRVHRGEVAEGLRQLAQPQPVVRRPTAGWRLVLLNHL